MNRRSLFKGLAATVAAVPFAGMATKGYITGERGPELFISNARVGAIYAGQITSSDGAFTIDMKNGRIRIDAPVLNV